MTRPVGLIVIAPPRASCPLPPGPPLPPAVPEVPLPPLAPAVAPGVPPVPLAPAAPSVPFEPLRPGPPFRKPWTETPVSVSVPETFAKPCPFVGL